MSGRAPTGYGHNRVDSVPFSTTDTAIGSPISEGFHSSASTQDGRDSRELQDAKPFTDHLDKSANDDTDSLDGLEHLTEMDPVALEEADPVSTLKKKQDDRPTWRSMPRKGQLALLVASRLAEPIAGTGLQSYMYYMLKSYDASLSDTQISEQSGWISAAFTAAQAVSAVFWGRLADKETWGRKKVLMIGLSGTAISMLGLGFAQSYYTLMFWRVFAGLLNGNVGVIRTMVKEMITEKKFHNRAFMLLPMTFNIGMMVGPTIGGYLSEPVEQWPSIFGPGSFLGGQDGIQWMARYPYALPNVISAVLLGSSALALFLFLHETHECLRDKEDAGARIRKYVWVKIFGRRSHAAYTQLGTSEMPIEMGSVSKKKVEQPIKKRRVLPFRRIWTRNVLIVFLAHGLHSMHVGTFQNVWSVFLSAPRFDPVNPRPAGTPQVPPIHFTGGLGMSPAKVGNAMSIVGIIGIFAQFILYPRNSERLGIVRSYRLFSTVFPFAYILTPYLVLLPSSTIAPAAADGALVWIGISCVLFVYVLARTFSIPSMQILVNNCCPHPTVLSTMNGCALSWGALCRTIGPALAGWLLGRGLKIGIVGLAFWTLAGISVLAAIEGTLVKDGSDMQIDLQAEEEERLTRERHG